MYEIDIFYKYFLLNILLNIEYIQIILILSFLSRQDASKHTYIDRRGSTYCFLSGLGHGHHVTNMIFSCGVVQPNTATPSC